MPGAGQPVPRAGCRQERLATTPAVTAFSTPRRLAALVSNVAEAQPDLQEQLLGPSEKVAFKDSKPTPAAEAFARKAGVEVSKLGRVTNPKGTYISANVTRK